MTVKRILGPTCFVVVCGILWLGLWPLRRPRNDATWLGKENGLRLSGYGTMLSTESFQMPVAEEEAQSSLEIWVEPGLTIDSSTLLTFSTPKYPLQFSMQQYLSTLILKRRMPGQARRRVAVGVEGVLHQGRPVFVTITSGPAKTATYVDGQLARIFPDFRVGTDFTGQLVIGTSAVRTDGWLGKVKGLAIYNRELTADVVRRHFESWTSRGAPEVTSGDNLKALYLFDEETGRVVHNVVGTSLDLYIPKRFSLLHQPFLTPFWTEYTPNWDYLRDTMMNVVGFVPLGFVFCAYWTLARPIKSATLASVAVGFAVSLTIEMLQSFLPTRNSGTTDLFTNSFGTFLGARLFFSPRVVGLLVWASELGQSLKKNTELRKPL